MCVCCKGVCTTAAPLEVIQYMLQLNSVSLFPEQSKVIWRKGLRSWHITGSGCLTLTTFTCVYVTSADKRICSFWSALQVSKKQCCGSGRLFAHPQLIPGAGESCSAEKAHVLILHSVHECRDEVQLLMLMQKMALISASPAVVLKIFSIVVIVCFATQSMCWNPYRCSISLGISLWLVFWFKDNLASHHNLVQLQLAVGLWRCSHSLPRAMVIWQMCIFFDSALHASLQKIFMWLTAWKVRNWFSEIRQVYEFLTTSIKIRKIRVGRQAIIAFNGVDMDEHVFIFMCSLLCL